MFPYFEIFGRTVGMYGVCAVVGLLVCGFLCSALGRRYGLYPEDIVMVFVLAGGGILIGGHLLYGFLQLDSIISNLKSLEEITFSSVMSCIASGFGGSVFYGGFLGSLATVAIYGKYKGKKTLCLDLLAVSTPLFHFFGRIGCFLGGCCYGIESQFGFIAHNNPYVTEINGVSRFPVQLLEAVLNLLLFFLIFCLFKKGNQKGRLIPIYIIIYSVMRFCLEFLRGDIARGSFLFFSTSQWISLVLLPISVTVYIVKSKRKHNKS